MDSVIQAAWIQAVGAVLASVITGATAAWIGKRWLNQESLKKRLDEAQRDVAFLMQVERHYTEQTKSIDTIPGRNTVRDIVKDAGYTWSGNHTPGRVKSVTRQI